MNLHVFIIVLIAALLHASWNFAARKVRGNPAVLWLGVVLASLCSLPFAIVLIPDPETLSRAVPYIAATGIIHAVYFGLLGKAYKAGEISTVYPIARGSGVIGTGLIAWLLLEEHISLTGCVGIAIVCAGIIMVGMSDLRLRENRRAVSLALLVGVTIALYSVVDKTAVGIVNPVFYICGMSIVTSIILLPGTARYHRVACKEALRNMKREIGLIGLGAMGTYVLILFAFQLGKVSYIVAAREVSVVFGALLGVIFLKEGLTISKALGVIVITVGLVIIRSAP